MNAANQDRGWTFWKDREQRILNVELFSQKAEDLARRLKDDKNKNRPSQLRKFYDQVLEIDARLRKLGSAEDFEVVRAQLHLLLARSAYAQGRGLITGEFREFLKACISQIRSPEDLAVFRDVFEAFMAYYKMYRPKD